MSQTEAFASYFLSRINIQDERESIDVRDDLSDHSSALKAMEDEEWAAVDNNTDIPSTIVKNNDGKDSNAMNIQHTSNIFLKKDKIW